VEVSATTPQATTLSKTRAAYEALLLLRNLGLVDALTGAALATELLVDRVFGGVCPPGHGASKTHQSPSIQPLLSLKSVYIGMKQKSSRWVGRTGRGADTIGSRSSTMNDSHQKAAELHQLAAHAHSAAMEHHGKGDHQTGHEHSKLALEHSTKAFELAQAAHRESEKLVRK